MSTDDDGKTADPIMDLGKWIEKTVEAVRRICEKKQAPCVGFSLVFFDPLNPVEDERWNYVIELAFDPHNPPSPEESENLKKAFEYISEGIHKIYTEEEREVRH